MQHINSKHKDLRLIIMLKLSSSRRISGDVVKETTLKQVGTKTNRIIIPLESVQLVVLVK